mmetsp:Transcript_23437/g.71996  ORF Transcript_23437/g.71996 Transcript_23437/m.71996 type:complete len:233 (+) Transcript_23437:1374-2072(+)
MGRPGPRGRRRGARRAEPDGARRRRVPGGAAQRRSHEWREADRRRRPRAPGVRTKGTREAELVGGAGLGRCAQPFESTQAPPVVPARRADGRRGGHGRRLRPKRAVALYDHGARRFATDRARVPGARSPRRHSAPPVRRPEGRRVAPRAPSRRRRADAVRGAHQHVLQRARQAHPEHHRRRARLVTHRRRPRLRPRRRLALREARRPRRGRRRAIRRGRGPRPLVILLVVIT